MAAQPRPGLPGGTARPGYPPVTSPTPTAPYTLPAVWDTPALDRTTPGQRQDGGTPTPPGPSAWNADAKRQMDEVFARYGRTPREDEYAQWIGPAGYIMRNDVDGAGRQLLAYAGGAIDPYWLSRMAMHAQGDYWGNGATPDTIGFGQMSAQGQQTGGASVSDINSLLNAFGTPGGPFSIASSYLDPDTQALLNFVRDRVQTLTTPTLDPALEAYVASAQSYADRLQTPWTNPQSAQATSTLQQILDDVTGAPFTDAQMAGLKASAYDQLGLDQTAATRRATAQMAALGHGRESGTIAEVLSEVSRSFDQARAAQNRDILVRGIDQTNRNRDTAMSVSDMLRSIASQDFALNETRGAQAVGALQEVSNARARQRAENEARQQTALALSSIPVQLADSRLQTAMQVLGLSQGVNPTNIFNSLSNLLQSTQANTMAQNQQNSTFWLGLGQMLAQLPWNGEDT